MRLRNEEFVEKYPAKLQRPTHDRLEHIDVPVADGVIRWYVIRRHLQSDDDGSRYDTDWYRSEDARPSFFRKLLGTAKRKLLFWR